MSHLDVLTQYRSPFDAFAQAAARRPDAPFLIAPASAELSYARDGFRISYGEPWSDKIEEGIKTLGKMVRDWR